MPSATIEKARLAIPRSAHALLDLPRVHIPGASTPLELERRLRDFNPRTEMGLALRTILATPGIPAPQAIELMERYSRCLVVESALYGILWRSRENGGGHDIIGLLSKKVITTAGVNWLETAFLNTVEPETMKYHGIGTGGAAEAVGDTALGAESTTALNPDNTRATGSLTTGGSANIFRTVGTNTVDSSVACVEHGVFNQAATGGGTLWDRSLFSVLNLANGDSLTTTYDLTLTAGG